MIMTHSYPSWQTFAFKYQGREQEIFEDLARNLFRKEMGITTGLNQRVNHKGNETDVVYKNGNVYGFQAKYFKNGIDADNIIHSMIVAKKAHPEQTHYYIYSNQAFGNPRKRKDSQDSDPVPDMTKGEEKLESAANELGLKLVWKLNKAILDEVMADDRIYDIFFSVDLRQEKTIDKCTDKLIALKMLYDLLIKEADVIDTYVINIVNIGGIDWYIHGDKKDLWGSVYIINEFINENRFFFSDSVYVDVSNYFNIARDLGGALDCVVQAIYSSTNSAALTDVFDLTYQQDIQCNAKFVWYIMDEFTKADGGHPAYNDFAAIYEHHEQQRNKILAIIEKNRGAAVNDDLLKDNESLDASENAGLDNPHDY